MLADAAIGIEAARSMVWKVRQKYYGCMDIKSFVILM